MPYRSLSFHLIAVVFARRSACLQRGLWFVAAAVTAACGGAAEGPVSPAAPGPAATEGGAISTAEVPSGADSPSDQREKSGHGPPHGHGQAHADSSGSGPDHHEHSFADAERYAQHFDAPERATWQKPKEVVAAMALTPGMHVADLGAGTGYFLPHLSRAVGPQGTVVGLDVEPAMVDYIVRRIQREGLTNVTAERVDATEPNVAPNSFDRILIVNTWHHLPNRVHYAKALTKALRPGGALFIVDFTRDSPMGPPERYRFTVEQVTNELTAGGFEVQLIEETLPYQFMLRAVVP